MRCATKWASVSFMHTAILIGINSAQTEYQPGRAFRGSLMKSYAAPRHWRSPAPREFIMVVAPIRYRSVRHEADVSVRSVASHADVLIAVLMFDFSSGHMPLPLLRRIVFCRTPLH